MAAIILPDRWRRQPDGPVEINTADPLASGLAWARSFGFGPLTRWGSSPFLRPQKPGVEVNGTVSLSTGSGGRGVKFGGASGDSLVFDENVGSGTKPIGDKIVATGQMSVFVIARRDGAGNGEEGIAGPLSGVRWRLTANSAGNKKLRWLILGAATNVYATTAIQDGADFSGGGTVTSSRVAIYFNGIEEASTGGDTINTAGETFSLGNGQGNFNGLVYFAAIWWRALSAPEMKALHDAPYSLYLPLRRRLYFAPPAGAASATADAALQEAADNIAAAVSVSVGATSSLFESGDILSAVSGVAITASAQISESADFIDATAGTASFATAALYERGDSVSAAVTLAVTGAAALAEAADQVNSAAAVTIVGVAALQEVGDRLEAEGGSASFATAALLEAADSSSATGAVLVSATAALLEAADLPTSAAVVLLSGQAALVEAADTVSAAATVGTVTSTADAALYEARDAVSATAVSTITGDAALIEAGDIVVSGAAAAVSAAANLYEQADVVSASAAMVRFAEAALYEQGDVLDARLIERIARRIAASDARRWTITPSDGLN